MCVTQSIILIRNDGGIFLPEDLFETVARGKLAIGSLLGSGPVKLSSYVLSQPLRSQKQGIGKVSQPRKAFQLPFKGL